MHPIERLRAVARARDLDQTLLASEAASVLGSLAFDPMSLLTSCRRLIDRHPAAGALWWACARLLAADDAREFLGPWAQRMLTFADRDRDLVKAIGVNELPAFVHLRQDRSVAALAEGWDPPEWRDAVSELAKAMSWTRPNIPGPADPKPYPGSPALGA